MDELQSNANAAAAGKKKSLRNRRPSALTAIAAAVWLSAVVGALAWIVNYSNLPGASGSAPKRWPAQSKLQLDPVRPTLIMFAHPHCPCTRASLGELELLLARCGDKLSAHIVFIRPAGTAESWTQTDLWRRAAVIPGLTVHRDDEGVESKLFHSETSGTTVMYEPDGALQFQGGITISRGHSGDNPGRSALVDLVERTLSTQVKTPVFGCPLFNGNCDSGGAECKP